MNWKEFWFGKLKDDYETLPEEKVEVDIEKMLSEAKRIKKRNDYVVKQMFDKQKEFEKTIKQSKSKK